MSSPENESVVQPELDFSQAADAAHEVVDRPATKERPAFIQAAYDALPQGESEPLNPIEEARQRGQRARTEERRAQNIRAAAKRHGF